MSAWQVLSRDESGVAVLRCPEGHIHVEAASGMVTLRLSEEQFIAFARTMAQAARTVANGGLLRPFEVQPLERFSRN
jgi:hypothetical protein